MDCLSGKPECEECATPAGTPAEAWDAGYCVGVAHAQMPPGVPFKANPYRPKSGQFTVTSTVNPDMAKAIVEMLRDYKRRTGLETLGL